MRKALDLVVTHQSPDIAILQTELDAVIRTLRWESRPSFLHPGRTGWFFFEHPPVLVEQPDCIYHAAKLKGVGIWNPATIQGYSGCRSTRFFDKPSPPTTDEYEHRARSMHFGFSEDREFRMVNSDPAPYGGITRARAIREYDNGRRLMEHSVPATVPLLVVRYEGLKFRGEPLGAVVSLVPDDYPCRCHPLVLGDSELSQTERRNVEKMICSLSGRRKTAGGTIRADALRTVYREYGARIRGFAGAGLYRHAGGTDNVIYSVQRKQLLLTDLDSSRDLADVPKPNQGLEVLRDVASVMYRLLSRICHPSCTGPLPVGEIIKHDPLGAVIDGFLGPQGVDGRNDLAKALWLAYLPHHFIIERNREPILAEYAERSLNEWQALMMQTDLFYILAILLLYRLYPQGDLAAKWPCGFQYDDLLGKAERCLGDRFRYLASLLNVGTGGP